MARTVSVVRHAPGGFLSGFTFDFTKATVWQEADWFAPGMIYGGFAHLSDAAIGGRRYYLPGAFAVRIREDRLPGRCLPPTSVMAHRWRCSIRPPAATQPPPMPTTPRPCP